MRRIGLVLALAASSALMAQEVKECKLYSTNFQDWTKVSKGTSVSTQQAVTKYSNENLTFSFCETEISPDGTNAKFTADFITPGYAMADKKTTPYIETTALKSITKVHYVHAATGGERGWGLQYRVEGESEWTTVHSDYCKQAGTQVDVAVNKENVQLRWYNLNGAQNAYMTEMAIYGMAEDDGSPTEYTISYFDQDGNRLGDTIQNETETLTFAFSEADLTVPEGFAFRGWYDGSRKRHEEGEAIDADLRLNALVTPVEVAETGRYYSYDLTSPVFYPEDHELISVEGEQVKLVLSGGKAVIMEKRGGKESFTQLNGKTSMETPAEGLQAVSLYFVQEFVQKDETGYIILSSGDAAALVLTLKTLEDGARVFLPDGVYDLGETVLSQISASNVSLIGQSMDKTIIRNAPDYRTESINNTATLYLTGTNIYLQDLTIQNALDYYRTNNGRAVALWAKNSKTICKNVRLLSYQDTYYSNKVGGLHFMADCEIHGTVDFICGDGSVYFLNNLLFCEKRASGEDVLTASNADAKDKGYVFESCTIRCAHSKMSLGRAWNNKPQVAFLNTVFDYSEGEFSLLPTRWTQALMNQNAWPQFGEFGSHTLEGEGLTPESNVVTFIDEKSGNTQQDAETVLSAEQAAAYTIEYTLGDWAETAKNDAKQAVCEQQAEDLEPDAIYLAEADGEFVMLLKGSEFFDKLALYDGVVEYKLRKANARGGFGPRAGEETEGVGNVPSDQVQTTKLLRDGQLLIVRGENTFNALGARL